MRDQFVKEICSEGNVEEEHVYVIHEKEMANEDEEEDEEFLQFFEDAKYRQAGVEETYEVILKRQ
jgi:hypothetical protein